MKPFKFFFTVAVGIILFSFVARVFFGALVFAGIMSLIYFVFTKVKNFFRYLTWDNYEYEYAHHQNYRFNRRHSAPIRPGWKFENDLLVDDWDNPRQDYAEQIIKVM